MSETNKKVWEDEEYRKLHTKENHYNYNYNLTDKDSDYTLVYMLDESMFHRSGFLLVNNTTGKVYNYNISLEVIK